ncbi:hypothetical protein EPUL_004719 [Erysiphe pulchra]|uniref:Uncharacterized protein n=1 Tax=Erysiphe pulchra TaxID=225359 RepID=A0A2S4PPD8_9PEZI|nr:hypothetical protein EPUL_004719 [Erysiphe pulchra]
MDGIFKKHDRLYGYLPRDSRSFNGKEPSTSPNSPSPFVSPIPPLNLQLPIKTTDGRQILKPVAPSKRPVTERPYLTNKPNFGNAFLPKELAEIVAIRQRCERAWHARLMICTAAISSIESKLANFKDEIEKEEVAAFKAYLQLAIAKFAAVDTSPNPPKIPTHSRPSKGSGHGLGKEKTAVKKVAVAFPRNTMVTDLSLRNAQGKFALSEIAETAENTWAIVARKGKKKARITLGNKATGAPVKKATQRVTNKEKSPSRDHPTIATTDKRLFLRLPQEHEWRKLSPAGIR